MVTGMVCHRVKHACFALDPMPDIGGLELTEMGVTWV